MCSLSLYSSHRDTCCQQFTHCWSQTPSMGSALCLLLFLGGMCWTSLWFQGCLPWDDSKSWSRSCRWLLFSQTQYSMSKPDPRWNVCLLRSYHHSPWGYPHRAVSLWWLAFVPLLDPLAHFTVLSNRSPWSFLEWRLLSHICSVLDA